MQQAWQTCVANMQPSPSVSVLPVPSVANMQPSMVRKTTSKVTFAQRARGYPVMGKYTIFCERDAVLGEGTSSVCRRGECDETGATVAIKLYKNTHAKGVMQKFQRQVDVLLDLQKPFEVVDEQFWNAQLEHAAPSKLFMQLLHYSQDAEGIPCADQRDGELYVVTEIGQYSLKEYIKRRRDDGSSMSKECVRSIVKAMILVTAGLHAQSYCHLDLKPENLMVFSTGGVGRLKLIDVDGCVRSGSVVSIDDSSLSYSPCYCAPEWAKFLIDSSDSPSITIDPALDVWSIGMTVCELVVMQSVLAKTFVSFKQPGRSRNHSMFLYMQWLSELRQSPLSRSVCEFDAELVDLLSSCLLVGDASHRCPLAAALNHPYLSECEGLGGLIGRSSSSPVTNDVQATPMHCKDWWSELEEYPLLTDDDDATELVDDLAIMMAVCSMSSEQWVEKHWSFEPMGMIPSH